MQLERDSVLPRPKEKSPAVLRSYFVTALATILISRFLFTGYGHLSYYYNSSKPSRVKILNLLKKGNPNN